VIYHKGKSVTIKVNSGKYLEGIIIEPVDFSEQAMWWVEVYENENRDVNIYTVADLDEWNTSPIQHRCVCGSSKTNQPKHSTWCNMQ
jgi:hypothetical protein